MLKGIELGRAIGEAIQRKIDAGAIKSRADVARHFEIKTPSIYDWVKKGSISKDKLPELWRYFSDVVGPEHWGLSSWPDMGEPGTPAADPTPWPFSDISPDEYHSLSTYDKKMVENLAKLMLEEKRKNPRPPTSEARSKAMERGRQRAAGMRHGELQHVHKK